MTTCRLHGPYAMTSSSREWSESGLIAYVAAQHVFGEIRGHTKACRLPYRPSVVRTRTSSRLVTCNRD